MRITSMLVGCALACSVSAAAAADKFAECAAASEEGQSLRDQNQYRAARAKFRACGQAACPGVVRKDCTKALADLEEAMPSIVVAAVDERGADLVEVELVLDGETLATRLDGTAIAIDPGTHDLRATAAGRATVAMQIVARVGDKNRMVRMTLGAARVAPQASSQSSPPRTAQEITPTPLARPSHGPPLSTIVLGGVGVAALASWAIFGITAQSDFGTLKDTCGPSCPDGSADGIKTRMLVADLSLAVGVVALGAAAVLWIVHTPSAAKQATSSTGLHLGASPLPGGGAASFGGSF